MVELVPTSSPVTGIDPLTASRARWHDVRLAGSTIDDPSFYPCHLSRHSELTLQIVYVCLYCAEYKLGDPPPLAKKSYNFARLRHRHLLNRLNVLKKMRKV